jgi:hypothetical protein
VSRTQLALNIVGWLLVLAGAAGREGNTMPAEATSPLSVVVLLGLFSLGGLLFWLVTRRPRE